MFGNYKEKYDGLKIIHSASREDFKKLQRENDKLFRENLDLKTAQERLDEKENEIIRLKSEISRFKDNELNTKIEKDSPSEYKGTKRVKISLNNGDSIITYLDYRDFIALANRVLSSDARSKYWWMSLDSYGFNQDLKYGEVVVFTKKIVAIHVFDDEETENK